MSKRTQEWLPDPEGRHQLRWWDGTEWTEHVSDQGQQSTAPLSDSTTPPPAGASPRLPAGASSRRSARATAALVLGIVGIWGLLFMFPVVCSILAIIFGALALRDTSTDTELRGRSMAWWGLGLGLAGVLIFITLLAILWITY